MSKEIYEELIEGLNQVLAYNRGKNELPFKTYEYTFPDCPRCWHMNNNECIFKDKCIVQISDDGECRMGTPSRYMSMTDGEKIVDALNAIGCTSFQLSADEISKLILKSEEEVVNCG